jgi:hypothetical protein
MMQARADRRLRKDIVMVLAVKVLALTLLWSLFFRGHQVTVDADAAGRLLAPAVAPTQALPTTEGRSDGH